MDNGNITEKKTRQTIADELGINVKTLRNMCRYMESLEGIKRNIGEERSKVFESIVDKLCKNKKEKVSDNQILQLSRMTPEEQIRIVDLIIRRPGNAKAIINNAIPYCETKITVTLPYFVNEWLDSSAYYAGVSKRKYIESLLIGLYQEGNMINQIDEE